jgi:hypothetical protein
VGAFSVGEVAIADRERAARYLCLRECADACKQLGEASETGEVFQRQRLRGAATRGEQEQAETVAVQEGGDRAEDIGGAGGILGEKVDEGGRRGGDDGSDCRAGDKGRPKDEAAGAVEDNRALTVNLNARPGAGIGAGLENEGIETVVGPTVDGKQWSGLETSAYDI